MKRSYALMAVAGFWIACSGRLVTVEAAPQELSTAVCDKLNSCTPASIAQIFGDVATCKARSAISLKSTFTAPGTSVTSAQLGSCFDAIQSASCADLSNGNATLVACEFKGTLPNATACAVSPQCQSGYCSISIESSSMNNCGKCATRVALGGDCVTTACETNLFCDNVSRKCVARPKAGEACTSTTWCAAGTTCIGAKCSAPLGENADCSASPGGCDSALGLTCNASTKKCAKVSFASAGQDCGMVSGQYVSCVGTNYCALATGTASGKCTTSPKEPEDCTTSCLTPAQCNPTTKKCEIFDPATCK